MTVPSEYNVINGLLGLGPDIMLEILSEIRFILDAQHFLGVPVSIINNDPDEIVFSDVDGIMKTISKKTYYRYVTISLTQVLQNGIWQMKA
ncbi:MAG: hypothetical protein EZS28_040457, partial [Streblomastix strix]